MRWDFEASGEAMKIKLPYGKSFEISWPSCKTWLAWISGAAALASVVDLLLKLLGRAR
jgi:hypothetical protein